MRLDKPQSEAIETSCVKTTLGVLATVALLSGGAAIAQAASEIVVAIRYLKAQGTSHSELFLYREDGKMLRQLTNDNSAQITSPMFAPDGAIVFTREIDSGKDYWSIAPKGGDLHSLQSAPIGSGCTSTAQMVIPVTHSIWSAADLSDCRQIGQCQSRYPVSQHSLL